MFKRVLVCAILLEILLLPLSCRAASTSIVIYSFKVAGTKSTDEYVQLKNIGAMSVNLSGWQLSKKTASGNKYNLVNSLPAVEVLPGNTFVIAHKDSTKLPDFAYQTSYSIAEDNTIILYAGSDKTVVDKVGFGSATDFEGTPLPKAMAEIWSRKSDEDTDNNEKDFQKEASESLSEVDYSEIYLTEIMPDPGSGNEEWIEIYNSNESEIDISGLVISDTLGSTKKYKVPFGTKIGGGKYLVFYGSVTGISLNNDGDGVKLLGLSDALLDDSGESYGKAKTGQSYANDSDGWIWSTMPTPGLPNIIKVASDTKSETKTSKKSSAPKTKSTKSKAPRATVLGRSNENEDIFEASKSDLSPADQILGYILIGVALVGGLFYTIYVNKEKLLGVYNKERKGYHKSWRKLRKKMQRARNLSFIRRTGRG